MQLNTRGMAFDYVRQGIRIKAICLGDTITTLQKVRVRALGVDFEEYKAALGNALPIGRMAEPEKIAKPVLFLASDVTPVSFPAQSWQLMEVIPVNNLGGKEKCILPMNSCLVSTPTW